MQQFSQTLVVPSLQAVSCFASYRGFPGGVATVFTALLVAPRRDNELSALRGTIKRR